MQERRVSLTAMMSAYVRAHHATHDSPKIFDDSLACQMFTDETFGFLGKNLALALQFYDPERAAASPDEPTALYWVTRIQSGPIILSRAQYAEECLERAIREGVQQYVILGAGLDTFAFRRPELLERIEVFEVDHPSTQGMKRGRLAQLDWELPAHVHLVPIDFTVQTLAAVLEPAGYDRTKKSFFSWLGVTYYLAREVVLETLREIATIAPKGSAIVFDYMDADAFDPLKADKRIQRMHEIVRHAGEPMITGFDPATLGKDMEAVGLWLMQDLAPADIEKRYFAGRTDNYHAYPHVHLARLEVA